MKRINVLHLYPNEMNIYGDRGNLLTLQRRIAWHGYEPITHFHHAGEPFPEHMDFIFGGGGQDSAQSDIQQDVLRIGDTLHALAHDNVPMLMICGMYQAFCHRFVTQQQKEIKGIGIFDAETIGDSERMVGNVAIETEEFGSLFGFENHSGRTFLRGSQQPLGKAVRGRGNNGQDETEGARTANVFGSYLHGPMLPNNPQFADALIGLAATRRYGSFTPGHTSEHLSDAARLAAAGRRY